MVGSQQRAHADLVRSVRGSLQLDEQTVLGSDALVGVLPRLDVIASFLSRDLDSQVSCAVNIRNKIVSRINSFNGN